MKYIKTILLIAGLIASLSSTSYATKKQESKETIEKQESKKTTEKQESKETTEKQESKKTTEKQESKKTTEKQENKETTKKQENINITEEINTDSKDKKTMSEENKIKNLYKFITINTEIIKNPETSNKEKQDKIIQLIEYYQNMWDLETEQKNRNSILEKLDVLKYIYKKWTNKYGFNVLSNNAKDNKIIYENMSAFNSDFNLFQKMLVNYYKFSVSFSKYTMFVLLLIKNENEYIKQLNQYKTFMEKYNSFVDSIKPNVKLLHDICSDFFLQKSQNPKYSQQDDIHSDSKSPKTDMAKNILNFKSNLSNLKEIFNKDPKSWQQDNMNDINLIFNEMKKNISNLKSNFKKMSNKTPQHFKNNETNTLNNQIDSNITTGLRKIATHILNLESNLSQLEDIFNKNLENLQQNLQQDEINTSSNPINDSTSIFNDSTSIFNEAEKNISYLNSDFKEAFAMEPKDYQNYTKNDKNHNKIYDVGLNTVSEMILNLEKNFKTVFDILKIAIPSQTIWKNLFKENADVNNLIDENTDISTLDIIPTPYESVKTGDIIEYFDQNMIPPNYKLNLHILGTAIKMELIKSLSCLKELKHHYDKNSSQDPQDNKNILYNSLKQYVNKLYVFYNNLRFFVVYHQTIKKANYTSLKPGTQNHPISLLNYILNSKSAKTTYEDTYNNMLNLYTDDQYRYGDILSSSLRCINISATPNYNTNIFKSYYSNHHNVNNLIDLYDHIQKNKSIYDSLVNDISLDKFKYMYTLPLFFILLDNNTPDKFFNKFYYKWKDTLAQSNINKNFKPFKNIKYMLLDSKKEILEKNIKLLEYYNNVWDSQPEKQLRVDLTSNASLLKNIFQKLMNNETTYQSLKNSQKDENQMNTEDKMDVEDKVDDKDNINADNKNDLNKFLIENKALIYKNISNSNFDFNLLQSILLDYYNFSISFNKYNMFMHVLSKIDFEKISKLQNEYEQTNKDHPLNELYENLLKLYKTFKKNYEDFINTITEETNIVDTLCKFFFVPNGKDPKIFQKYNENNLTNLDDENKKILDQNLQKMKKNISKLESSFQKIFKMLNITLPYKIESEKIIKNNTKTKNIIEKIAKNAIVDIMSEKVENTPGTYKANGKNLIVSDNNLNIKVGVDYQKSEKYELNNVPPHYRLNLHMLGTVVKMELIKSLKSLNAQNPNSNEYDKLQEYINTLFYFYNYLKTFITYSMKFPDAKLCKYSDKQKNKFYNNPVNLTKRDYAKKNIRQIINKYIYIQNAYQDILGFSVKNIKDNYLDKMYLNNFMNIFEKYYFNRHNVDNASKLYDNITSNNKAYENLVNYNQEDKINAINDFDKFFIALDNPKNRYFDKFYQSSAFSNPFKPIPNQYNQSNVNVLYTPVRLDDTQHNPYSLNYLDNLNKQNKEQQDDNDPIVKKPIPLHLNPMTRFTGFGLNTNTQQNFNTQPNLSYPYTSNFPYTSHFDNLFNRPNDVPRNVNVNEVLARLNRRLLDDVIFEKNKTSNLNPANTTTPQQTENLNIPSNNQDNKSTPNIVVNINQMNIINQPQPQNPSNTPSSNKSDSNILGNKTKRNKTKRNKK